jgi:DNA-binding CsgD family transcriptional regulator
LKTRYRTPSILPEHLGCRRTGLGGSHFYLGAYSPPYDFTETSTLAFGTILPPTSAEPSAIWVMREWMQSPLQKACLRWVSQGRTIAEISLLEGKTVAEIESCLQSALVALNAKSLAEALQKMNLSD